MAKKRQGEPWMQPADYGRSLPPFTVNLIVREAIRSVAFYTDVMGAALHYQGPDFAALRMGEPEFMLHTDHTYDSHPWFPMLAGGERRGLGLTWWHLTEPCLGVYWHQKSRPRATGR